MDVAYGIVQSMVAYVGSGNKFTRKQDAHLMLGKNQRVRIEDILQIFVDQHDLMTDFLKRILDEYKTEANKERFKDLEKLTQIKLYNRLLECYLVKKQRLEIDRKKDLQQQEQFGYPNPESSSKQIRLNDQILEVQKHITELVDQTKFEKIIDEHYMLFLFKIYDSEQGI